MNRKSCKGCVYLRSLSGMGEGDMVCCYAIDTPDYKIRPCRPEKCTVKETKGRHEKPV